MTDETIDETTSTTLEDTGIPVNLVTGTAGKAHVTSEDAAALNRAIIGPGLVVVGPDAPNIGRYMSLAGSTAPSIKVENTLHVVWDGRFVIIDPVEIDFDAAASGQGRIDAVALTYRRDADTGVETMSLEVFKGTPSSGALTAPTVPYTGSAYVPSLAPSLARRVMWYITIRGTNLSNGSISVAPDYDVLLTQPASGPLTRPYTRYRPTVETSDTLPSGRYVDDDHHLWQVAETESGVGKPSRVSLPMGTPGPNWQGYITAAADIDGRVFADIAITRAKKMDQPASNGYTEQIGKVPAGYRPRYTCYFPAYSTGCTSGVDHSTIWLQVDSDGGIKLRFENRAVWLNINGYIEAHVSWAIA